MMYGEYANIVNLVERSPLEDRTSSSKTTQSPSSLADKEEFDDFEYAKKSEDRSAALRKGSLSDALLFDNTEPTVLIAGQPPFYVEAVTKSWTSVYGWESDQVLGHNLNFLKGDDAKVIDVALLYSVVYTESSRTSTIRGYSKDGTQFSAKVTLSPVYDIATTGSQLTKHLSHIAIKFSEFKTFNGFLSSDLNEDYMGEVGMPLDRREYCLVAVSSLDASSQGFELLHVTSMIRSSSLSGVMKVAATLRTPLAIIVTDREGKLVHANPEFTGYFGWDLHAVQGRKLDFLLGENSSEDTKRILTEQSENAESFDDSLKYGTDLSGTEVVLYGKRRKPADYVLTLTPIADLFDNLFRPAVFVYCVSLRTAAK